MRVEFSIFRERGLCKCVFFFWSLQLWRVDGIGRLPVCLDVRETKECTVGVARAQPQASFDVVCLVCLVRLGGILMVEGDEFWRV